MNSAGWMWAFTVSPVWGLLIIDGSKDVENRSFRPKLGETLVHCSQGYTMERYLSNCDWIRKHVGDVPLPDWADCLAVKGMIIGSVKIESAAYTSESRWWDGSRCAWGLAGPKRCVPVRARGNLGLWKVAGDLLGQVKAARREWIHGAGICKNPS